MKTVIRGLCAIVAASVLAGCGAVRNNAGMDGAGAPFDSETQTYQTRVTLRDVDLVLTVPPGWESFPAADSITLTNSTNPVQTGDHLGGVLLSLFVPDTATLTPERAGDPVAVLQRVTQAPTLNDVRPTEIAWGQQPAAYYTLYEPNAPGDTATLVVVVQLPEDKLLGLNASVPHAQTEALHDYLALALANFSADGVPLDGGALMRALPNPLAF